MRHLTFKYINMKTKKLLILICAVLFYGTVFSQEVYDYTDTLQTYTVPSGVYSIEIEAIGAAGGKGSNGISGVNGKGASMKGRFNVVPGQEFTLLVGGQGQSAEYVGGGGGGTYVWATGVDTLLIAAGGGGGGGASDGAVDNKDGMDATITELGTNGNGFDNGSGAVGMGAVNPSGAGTWSGGGAGFGSNGNDGTTHGCAQNCTGGTALGAGGLGGGTVSFSAANGGYGGGGGGNARCGAVGGGGGGGYSGGGAGGELVSGQYNGGGGGGSYNVGLDQENTVGVGVGNGQIIITEVCNPIEVSYTTTDELLGADGTIDITVTGGSNSYSFDWDNDGTGDFDDTEDLTGLAGGTYVVVIQDSSICDNVTDSIVVNSQLGLTSADIDVNIYPNPTSDYIQLSLAGEFNYEVSAIGGQSVLVGKAFDQVALDLSSYKSGTYLVKINVGTIEKVISVIKN